MRTLEALLTELRTLDVRVWSEEGRLRYSAPKGALAPGLLDELRERKAELLQYLQQARVAVRPTLPSLEQAPRGAPLPLSFPQQRLWFLDRFQQDGAASYNMPGALRLEGPLDVGALERAFAGVIQRHEVLRTIFPELNGEAAQVILPELSMPLEVVDLQELPEPERAPALRQLAVREAGRRFELARGPLMRAVLARLGARSHVLLLTLHHIVADAWSLGIFFRELGALYAAAVSGRPAQLPALPLQYADFAVWQRKHLGTALDAQREYWKRQLAGAPALLELPTDRPRPAVQSFRGATVQVALGAEVTARLRALGERHGATLYMTLLAAFQVLLSRYSGQQDVSVGSPVANRRHQETEGLIGFFINMVVLRTRLEGGPSFVELLKRVRDTALDAFAHQDVPFEQLVELLQPERNLSYTPLFQVMFMLQNASSGRWELPGLDVSLADFDSVSAKFDLTLSLEETASGLKGWLEYNQDLFDEATAARMASHYRTLVEAVAADPEQPVGLLPLLPEAERRQLLREWNETRVEVGEDRRIHRQIEAQARRTPGAVALVFQEDSLTYAELNARANRLAHHLRALGAGPGSLVGLCVERSLEMVVGMLGILKAGAAYLPLDPSVPAERLAFMLEDAEVPLLLTHRGLVERLPTAGARIVKLDADWPRIAEQPERDPEGGAAPEDRAYVLYTSGSTGRPKGVELEHRHVTNFFAGMDAALGREPGTWLAVTTISFDISVLELLWTLSRGYRVILQGEQGGFLPAAPQRKAAARGMDFSLLYFASAAGGAQSRGKYRLLLEGAKFADTHGFTAVWTPERHFHEFGDLYPNPSVTSAAIAAVTQRVRIRAGSVVVPLHDPLRIAEEWAVVDNLSEGRVDISFASGWQANDFVLAPERYARRKELMLQGIQEVRKLWRGGTVQRVDGNGRTLEVRTLPRPVQPELPMWLTVAGNEETFRAAGELGAHVLTHLLGQSLEQLERKLAVYREAWRRHGHGGEGGKVTLMLHTFVGADDAQVRETVRGPFREYLRSSLDLLTNLARSLGMDLSSGSISPADMDFLLDHGFERFYATSGLFGSPETCLRRIDQLKELGVDEVACLIDFGVDPDAVLASLPLLDQVRVRSQQAAPAVADYSVPTQLRRHAVTHLQCTPSLARLLAEHEEGLPALRTLGTLLLGGEELPPALLSKIQQQGAPRVLNMYGPTETTVWSSVAEARERAGRVSIGRPIANTQLYVLDGHQQPVPVGVPGELFIGGDSVARGYLKRPELSAERFIVDPFHPEPGRRMYRTGDLARYRADGEVEFLGRADNQVKLRGFRIELGEIEAVLARHPHVRQAVAAVRTDASGEKLLVAYVVPEGELETAGLRKLLASHLPDYMVPGIFVTLEALPRTPNGKIDRRALPAPKAAGPASGAAFLAPRTTSELQLVALWEELLKQQPVGVRDNFFSLGGHSLLAVQLMAHIERRFGRRLPLATLFRAPTVEQLAAELEQSGPARRPLLVELHKGSGGAPVFCVPGAGGNLIYFHSLVRHLGLSRPVFGLQPVYQEQLKESSVVEELATQYLAALREQWPRGPYAFVGHSFGGVIAFEMARRLREQGEEVSLLGILDSFAPLPRSQPLGADWDQAEWLRLIGSLLLRLYGQDLRLDVAELRRLSEGEQVALLMERMKEHGLLPPEADATQFRGFVRTFQADQQSTYVPPKPYAGRMTFFRAEVLHPDNMPVEELRWTLDEPALGWGRFAAGPVEVIRVPGDHLSMMTEPHVRVLAQRLAESLHPSEPRFQKGTP